MNVFHILAPIAPMAIVLALTVTLLLIRDRRTLRKEMSQAERRRVIEQNSARTVHWSHVLFLVAGVAALVVNFRRTGHQPPWAIMAEIALMAFVVFKYYRDRAEDRIEPRHSSKA